MEAEKRVEKTFLKWFKLGGKKRKTLNKLKFYFIMENKYEHPEPNVCWKTKYSGVWCELLGKLMPHFPQKKNWEAKKSWKFLWHNANLFEWELKWEAMKVSTNYSYAYKLVQFLIWCSRSFPSRTNEQIFYGWGDHPWMPTRKFTVSWKLSKFHLDELFKISNFPISKCQNFPLKIFWKFWLPTNLDLRSISNVLLWKNIKSKYLLGGKEPIFQNKKPFQF
jgi:hypothetical protein